MNKPDEWELMTVKLQFTLPLPETTPGLLLGAVSPLPFAARLEEASIHAIGVTGAATIVAGGAPLAEPLALQDADEELAFALPQGDLSDSDALDLAEGDGVRVAVTTTDEAPGSAVVAHLALVTRPPRQ